MPNSKLQSARNKEGKVCAIPLESGHYAFCRALAFPLVEFYDVLSEKILNIEQLKNRPILFRVWVMKYALTERRWKTIGRLPLNESDKITPWFCKQDPDGSIYLTQDGAEEKPASLEDCATLEYAAVWDPEHVEDRLRDHFSGKSNKWVESLRPKDLTQ